MNFLLRATGVFVFVLLSGCSDGPSSTFQVAKQGIFSGAFDHKASRSVVASIHHGGSLWDVSSKARLYSWNHQSEGFSSFRVVAMSGDGRVAVTAEERSLGVWNASTGESLGFWLVADRVLALALDLRGEKALVGMRDGSVEFFDLSSGQTLHRVMHIAEVRSVAISDDATVGVSGGDDQFAIAWDLTSGKEMGRYQHDNQVKLVAISADGSITFSQAQRDGARLWDTQSATLKAAIESRYTNYTAASFDDAGRRILLGTAGGVVEQRNVANGDLMASWQSKPRQWFASASSKAILSVSRSGPIRALSADGLVQEFKR